MRRLAARGTQRESDDISSPWEIWLLVGFLVLWGAVIFAAMLCAMVVCVS